VFIAETIPASRSAKCVELNVQEQRVDVWAGHAGDVRWPCPECGAGLALYDHAEERVWRHLDSCQFMTYLHAQPPPLSSLTNRPRGLEPGLCLANTPSGDQVTRRSMSTRFSRERSPAISVEHPIAFELWINRKPGCGSHRPFS
jgi:zinc-finger of transposase IS204/IS1001/IS1096/IS1165